MSSSEETPSQPPDVEQPLIPEPENETTHLLAEPPDSQMDTTPNQPPVETWDDIPDDVKNATVEEIQTRSRLIENDIRVRVLVSCRAVSATMVDLRCSQVMRSETQRLQHEQAAMQEKIRDDGEKIKQNKVLPYLVGNVVEVGLYRLFIETRRSPTYCCNSRFSMSIQMLKRTVQTRISTLCVRENVP